jgi:hypothetical protein
MASFTDIFFYPDLLFWGLIYGLDARNQKIKHITVAAAPRVVGCMKPFGCNESGLVTW